MVVMNKRVRRPKLTLEQVRAAFAKEGLTLLEKSYSSSKQQLLYKCKCGKTRSVCWNNFARGTRCKLCFLEKFANPERQKQYIFKIQLREHHFNITEAARILGVDYDEFRNAVIYGALPPPKHSIPGSVKAHYREEDLDEIRGMIEIEEKPRPSYTKRQKTAEALRKGAQVKARQLRQQAAQEIIKAAPHVEEVEVLVLP